METQWTKTSDELPPAGVVVDTINIDGEQIKLHWRYRTSWFTSAEASAQTPTFWKLPDPVADAAQELKKELEDLIGLAEAAMNESNNDGGEYDVEGELESARALLEKLEGE